MKQTAFEAINCYWNFFLSSAQELGKGFFLGLILLFLIVPPLISWTDKTHHTQAAGCKARRSLA